MSTKQYELIVFDWDGTLMDSVDKIVNCFTAAIDEMDLVHPGAEAVRNIIGLGMREAMELLFSDMPCETQDIFISHYREHFLHRNQTEMLLFDGVRKGLEDLSDRGYLLAVATGKARRGLDRVLDETGLESIFVSTRCGDEALSKPHPKMLQDVLQQTGIAAERSIMVGDTVYDLQMASNAGIDSLAVSYGVHERQRLLDCGPRECLDSFRDVCQWLDPTTMD
ncbi:MAG TPA: HAD-IIIA family hydrolase [Acidiferrobacteraceae bacterium]|jgi:phosphoglycolate phosphatase|nr:HAD-IIIA family hydrolase [Acidiferrobacteraceae bacterium]HEX20617.1 HAD-IIIA family hydrolase [Acidiferrobacteraceae bacterium]